MKKLLTFLLLITAFTSSAQIYQNDPSYGRSIDRYQVLKALHIPTTSGVPNLSDDVITNTSAIAYDSAGHKFYVYDPSTETWGQVTGGGIVIDPGVDSITYHNNQLCQWVSGVSTCYFLNKFYDSTALNHDSTKILHFNSGNLVDSVLIPTGTIHIIQDGAGETNIVRVEDSTRLHFATLKNTDDITISKASDSAVLLNFTHPHYTKDQIDSIKATITADGITRAELIDTADNKVNKTDISGGAINQVLKKNSSTDYDWSWQDESGGSTIDTSGAFLVDADSVAPNTIRFYKGTGYKDFVFTGTDTSHLSNRIDANASSITTKFNISDTTGKWLADGVISVTTLPDSSGFVFNYKNGLSDTIKLSGVAGVSFYGKNETKDSTILLLTDGTRYAAKDSIGAGGGSVAGSNNQIQRNISGSLGASADFSYNSAGFLSGTKNYVGLFVNPVVTPTANTDTTSVAEFRKSFSNGALTGIINQTFKFSNQSGNGLSSYLNIDSLFNFTWGLGNAALPSGGNTISLGKFAGYGGTGADNSVNIGNSTGYNSTNQSNSVNIGSNAGYNAPSANTSINIGLNAGKNATSANTSINIGQNSASGATSASESINIGNNAGSGATGATRSINIGSSTGLNATGASNSVFSGFGAGSNATNATKSNFLGYFTGSGATGASYSFFEGFQTGYNGTHAITGTNNILIGTNITTDSANSTNTANIGNVFYLANTYGTTTGNPSKLAQLNGIMGINVNRPDTSTVADFESPLQTKGILIPRLPSVQKRLINTGIKTGSISGGTSYTTGSYPGISLTGGTGKGAIATVNVSVGGSVNGVVINYPGYDYSVGDVLTGTGFGAGSGFTYTVTALKVAPKGLILADTTQGLLNIYNGRKFGAMSAVFSKFDSTAQTSAISSLTSLVSDSLATYTIGGYLNVTAVSTDIIQLQCTYTDENNNNQTVSFGNISTVGNSNYSPITIRVKAGSTITIKSNLSTGGGSVTYDAGGYIRKDY